MLLGLLPDLPCSFCVPKPGQIRQSIWPHENMNPSQQCIQDETNLITWCYRLSIFPPWFPLSKGGFLRERELFLLTSVPLVLSILIPKPRIPVFPGDDGQLESKPRQNVNKVQICQSFCQCTRLKKSNKQFSEDPIESHHAVLPRNPSRLCKFGFSTCSQNYMGIHIRVPVFHQYRSIPWKISHHSVCRYKHFFQRSSCERQHSTCSLFVNTWGYVASMSAV